MEKFMLNREIPVEEGFDLVVAGGGPAGSAAAICAARLGAKVLLVEALGCLGGMGTSGVVSAFNPMANGEQMVVGGFMREVIETLYRRGYVPTLLDPKRWREEFHSWSPFDAEGLKLLLDELAQKAGVEVRFFTRVIDADVDAGAKQVKGLILSNVEGYRYIKVKTCIDATGDAVLADLCGAPYWEAGRDTPNMMPATLCALLTGIEWNRVNRSDIHLAGHQEKIEQAIADGFFSQPDKHVPGLFMGMRQTALMNAGHVFGMNAVNCRSLSDGVAKGRRLVQEYVEFYRKYMGLRDIQLVSTGAMMGARESRRVHGEYVLDYEDYKARKKFPDQIAIFANAVDIHVYDCTEEQYNRYHEEYTTIDRYAPGEYYGIPYGVLIPKGWKNLWVAGRCVSADVKVHGSLRVQPAASMMGQAAGVAAVQSIKTGKAAADIDTGVLVETLRSQGANLPQEKLSGVMTRK
ncbi:MAG: FAD-dependent oxidoreductase [Treponema sp.]|jgi:succinate dehydrogenase/fumarate reductase flavoprotein subunit|nr:FAD-dependent oxidoreductase [Treponema sp.]